MTKLICQNTGSYNRKTKISLTEEFIKPTLAQRSELKIDIDNSIVIAGKKYSIGEGARDIQSRVDSEIHRVCTIYDILHHSKDGDSVNIMLALPPNYYLNRPYREQYKKLLDNVLVAEVNGVKKMVFVEHVEVYMECAAAYLEYTSRYNGPVGIINFGGNTIIGIIFVDGKIVKESIVTLDLGMLKIERELIDSFNINNTGWNVQHYEIKGLMKDTDNKIVESVVEKYMIQLKNSLLEKKWNLGRIPLIASGGGALDMKENITRVFGNVEIKKDCVFDDVRGLWKVGEVIFR